MLHIISPKGKLMQIDTAVLVSERLIHFNGRRRLLQERAQNPKAANALALSITQEKNAPFSNANGELLVGNLPAEKAEEILKSLLSQGYFDFTEFTYQKAKSISEVTFDRGKSDPYTTEDMVGLMMSGVPFCSGNTVSMAVSAVDIDNSWCCVGMNSAPEVTEDQEFDNWDDEDGLEEEEDLDE